MTQVVLAGGALARVVETDGARAVLVSPVPAPPGSTVSGTLMAPAPDPATEGGAAPAPAEALPLQLKVRSCQKMSVAEPGDPAGSAPGPALFRIDGRLVSLSRRARELLLAPGEGSQGR